MNFEELYQVNLLTRQIVETENNITVLEKWIEELKEDATVEIRSNANHERSIIVLNGSEVLHLVEQRLGELKKRLEKLESGFNAL